MGKESRWATHLSQSLKRSNTINHFAKHAINSIMRVLYKFGLLLAKKKKAKNN